MLTLTESQRVEADRREPNGAITSLVEAWALYEQIKALPPWSPNRRADKVRADELVECVYARACELHDLRAAHVALDLAREHGFINRLVVPITIGAVS